MKCLTPSNEHAIAPGRAYSVYDTVRELEREDPDALDRVFRRELPAILQASQHHRRKSAPRGPRSLQDPTMLAVQMCKRKKEVGCYFETLKASKDKKAPKPAQPPLSPLPKGS
jgi:hypothetical protein